MLSSEEMQPLPISSAQRNQLQCQMQLYNAAMREVRAKLENWDEEFKIRFSHNPIHHIKHRLKTLPSILRKLDRKQVEFSVEAMAEHLHDIAGVRVICHYIDDVYHVVALLQNSGMEILGEKDYIQRPKENGYRSYHMVVSVPVQLSDRVEQVAVEIQLRTIAMDMWASLEHEMAYKSDQQESSNKEWLLKTCADELAKIDENMQNIYRVL